MIEWIVRTVNFNTPCGVDGNYRVVVKDLNEFDERVSARARANTSIQNNNNSRNRW